MRVGDDIGYVDGSTFGKYITGRIDVVFGWIVGWDVGTCVGAWFDRDVGGELFISDDGIV